MRSVVVGRSLFLNSGLTIWSNQWSVSILRPSFARSSASNFASSASTSMIGSLFMWSPLDPRDGLAVGPLDPEPHDAGALHLLRALGRQLHLRLLRPRRLVR